MPPIMGTAVPPVTGTSVPPATETAVPPTTGTAVPPAGTNNVLPDEVPEYDAYVIDGVRLEVVKVISAHSGEAKVFHVRVSGTDYALKLYKPQRHPNHEVLDVVMRTRGSGLLVDIYNHGVWQDSDGISYDFELMQYCQGRPLSELRLNGQADRLKSLAVQMAKAIDFCHRHGVLHRDIKPANFLYADRRETQLLLTDFGIGKKLDAQGRAATDGGRTPIYAAPEMYTYIPGRTTYVTAAADFYAMGMSLLALWTGEGLLTADEAKLVKDKQEETLPYPSARDMDGQLLWLIKELTRRNVDVRANFDTIVRWARGEINIRNEEAAKAGFRFVFSTRKNLVANSPKELARIMWENPNLAKDYLYQEQIENRFREMEEPELALAVHNLVEMKYPGDRDAGLYAACLLLDEGMPYFGKKGNGVATDEELAQELAANVGDYVGELQKPTHTLWVYCRAIGRDRLADEYPKIIRDMGSKGIFRLCYELDANFAYRLHRPQGILLIGSMEELAEKLRTGVLGEESVNELTGDDFITWVAARDQTLAGKLLAAKKKAAGVNLTGLCGWLMAYTVACRSGYDFLPMEGKNKSTLVTAENLAVRMADELNQNEVANCMLASQLATGQNFLRTRLGQYLWAREKYENQILWIQECMNLQSEDNKRKYTIYSDRTARMKAVTGLLNRMFPLKIGPLTLTSTKDFEQHKASVEAFAGKDKRIAGLVQDWLALQFQENPFTGSEKSFFAKAWEGLQYQRKHLPQSEPARRAANTEGLIAGARKTFSAACRTIRTVRWVTALVSYVPLTVMCIVAIFMLFTSDSDLFQELMEGIGTVLGVIVGILVGLMVFAYTHWLLGILAGWGAGYLVVYLCKAATPIVPWILVAALALVMYLMGRGLFARSATRPKDEWCPGMDPLVAEQRAILGDAYGSRGKLLPELPLDYPACIFTESAKQVKKGNGPLLRKAAGMWGLTIVVFLLVGWIGSQRSGAGTEESSILANVAGSYEGVFDDRRTTADIQAHEVEGEICWSGVITIGYSTPMTQPVFGTSQSDDKEHIIFTLKNEDGTLDKRIIYDARVRQEDGKTVIEGTYTNTRKGTEHDFRFVRKE